MRLGRESGNVAGLRIVGQKNRERIYRALCAERLTTTELVSKTGVSRSSVNDILSRLRSAGRVYVVCHRKVGNWCPEKVYAARFVACAAPQRPASIEYAGRREVRGYLWTDGAFL